MDYRGTFHEGVIRPDQPLDLPDGTPVEFQPVGPRPGSAPSDPSGSTAFPSAGTVGSLSDAERRALRGRFYSARTVEELAREQGVGPLRSTDDLRIPGITDEDIDDLLRQMRENRG